jgi:hypothetical protein
MIIVLPSPQPRDCDGCAGPAPWHIVTGDGFALQLCDAHVAEFLRSWRGVGLRQARGPYHGREIQPDR